MDRLIYDDEKEIIEKEFTNYSYEGERESDKKAYKEELVNLIRNEYEYGQVVRFDLCARILHYNLEDELERYRFKNMMNTVKIILEKNGKILKGISGVGYYILKPREISGFVYNKHIKKSRRTLDRAEELLEIVDESELNEVRKEELDNMKELTRQLQNVVDKATIESKYISRREYYESLSKED